MPDFPRYNSKGQINQQQTGFLAPEDNTGAVVGEAASNLGKTAQEIGVKWGNAVNTIQKTAATANFKSGLLDITNRAQNDPDYNNSDQYFKEIEKLKTDSLKGFDSKVAQAEAALDFGYDGEVARIQIQNLYKKKMIDVGQASTLKLLDLEAANGGPNIESRIGSILDPQVKAGIIGHEAAYKLQKEYVKKGKYNAFLSDLNSNPAETEARLKKNEYQFDIDQLEKARNIYASESKKIQAVTENEVLTAYLNGEDMDADSIRGLMNEGKIDARFAEGMISKLKDPKPTAASQDQAYIDFQNRGADALAKGDNVKMEEIVDLMSDTIKAHSSGLLDGSDVKRILEDRGKMLQKKLDPLSESVMENVQKKNWFERLSFWSDEYADKKPEIKARMYRKLVDGITRGEDGNALMSKILGEEIDLQLHENLKKPARIYSDNTETGQSAYSDDGGATWFDEKTGKEIK